MSVSLTVVFVALIAGAGVWVLSRSPRHLDPVDPAAEERWLVGWLVRHPRLGARSQAIDRRAIGGLMLIVALTITFTTALVVGALFDMVDRDAGLAQWDRAVAEWGSRQATAWSTSVLEAVTDLGATTVLILFAVAVAIADLLRNRNVNVPLFLIAVIAGVVLINNGLKLLVDRERPDIAPLVGASGSSFPSGHTSAAAAVWFALVLVVGRRWPSRRRALAAAGAAVITVAVATSRALLGVHWLTDVVAGVFLGWGWFLLCALVFGGRLQRLGEPAERVARHQRSVGPRC